MNKSKIMLITLVMAVMLCLCASGCKVAESAQPVAGNEATSDQTPEASPDAEGQGAEENKDEPAENENGEAPPDKVSDAVAQSDTEAEQEAGTQNDTATADTVEANPQDPIQTALNALGNLRVPVEGKSVSDLGDTFSNTNESGWKGKTLDITASEGTPVLAATDGVLVKLVRDEEMGAMIYQTNTANTYGLVYGRLSGFASGLQTGAQVKQGDVIGYVGDSGTIATGSQYLAFAVEVYSQGRREMGMGTFLNPFPLFTDQQSQPKPDVTPDDQKDEVQAVQLQPIAYFSQAAKLIGSSGAEALRNEVVRYASTFIGLQYRFGGTGANTGFDCSGFAQHVMRKFGVNLPRQSGDQFKQGAPVDKKDLRKGDLVFFTTYRPGASHVGIYIGDNRFIHSPSTGKRVRFDSLEDQYYWKPRYLGARRVLNLS